MANMNGIRKQSKSQFAQLNVKLTGQYAHVRNKLGRNSISQH